MATLSLSPPPPSHLLAEMSYRRGPLISSKPNATNSTAHGVGTANASLSPPPVKQRLLDSFYGNTRNPLTSNPNAANSPLRGVGSLAGYAKQKRSYAHVQREESYGQPPPVKKQALDNGTQRAVRSPSKIARPQPQVQSQRATTRLPTKGVSKSVAAPRAGHDGENETEVWKKHHLAKFPKMVFYFDSIPDDVRAKLTKRVIYLGAVCVLVLSYLSYTDQF